MIEYNVKVDENETKRWYFNGELHREDGPAIEYADGEKRWYLNDKRHRLGGPAIEYVSGDKEFWLNDKKVTEQDAMKSIIIIIDGKEIKLSKKNLNKLTKFIGELQ